MSTPGLTQDTAAFCADLVRNHDFSGYAATIFAPADRRRALLALYAFNDEIVRVREHISQPLPGEIRLQWWTDMLTGPGHGGVEGHPVAAELLAAIRAFGLPVDALTRLIEAHQLDLYNDPMPDMAALEDYLQQTSASLLSLAALVVGSASDHVAHVARHAGFAIGLTRIIATLPFDSSRRQMFLPRDGLERHGVDIESVFSGRATPELRAALNDLIAEARRHLDVALELLTGLSRDVRTVFLPLATARSELDLLARPDRDPFAPLQPSRLRTLWTVWRASRSARFRG